MAGLTLNIRATATLPQKLVVEFDATRFEKLAADFGFFNPEFIKSLERAETDERLGRVRKIISLKELHRTRQ